MRKKRNLNGEREYNKEYNYKNRVRNRNNYYMRKYGISLEDYVSMLTEQNGLCAICECEEIPNFSLSVDHDHETGKIRGLLCRKCNTALGSVNDNIELLYKFIEYLKKYQ